MSENRLNNKDRVGVCSWSFNLPLDQVAQEMRKMDVDRVNLAMQPFLTGDRHGGAESAEAQARALERVRSGEWKVTSTMISFPHEDYSSPSAIYRTGGVVPDVYWPSVRAAVERAAELTGELHVPYMLMHAGHLDWKQGDVAEKFVTRLSHLRDICADKGVALLLETGQESADDLVRLMQRIEGIGINFDPANMIDGNVGDPIEALETLFPWIRHMHVKDAIRPVEKDTWGREVPWGEGEVRSACFVNKLVELGYDGDFAIEREAGEDRVGDIRRAVVSLREMLSRSGK